MKLVINKLYSRPYSWGCLVIHPPPADVNESLPDKHSYLNIGFQSKYVFTADLGIVQCSLHKETHTKKFI